MRYEWICAREKKPIPWSEIVKGYEVSKGEHAVLTPEDFKRAALDRSETIDILAFVEAGLFSLICSVNTSEIVDLAAT